MRPQPRPVGFAVLGFVRVEGFGLDRGDLRQELTLILASGADHRRLNQLMFSIAADVRFVAVKTLAAFAGVTGVSVGGATFARGLSVRPLATGLNQCRIHQRGAFDNVTAGLQLLVEQAEQLLVQTALNESLAKPADGGLIGHGFVRVQLYEFLKAQPILELFLRLRVAQSVEMLQDHQAQQHADAAGGSSARTVGLSNALLGFIEIHFARDRFEHTVGAAALLHGQIKEGGLVVSRSLHGVQITSPPSSFKRLLQRFPSEMSAKGAFLKSRGCASGATGFEAIKFMVFLVLLSLLHRIFSEPL